MNLVSFAHESGRAARERLPRDAQKRLGQFMTPPAIARAMAERACCGLDLPTIRVLEPSAGCGVLAAAVAENIFQRDARPHRLELVLFEVDHRLAPALKRLAERIRRAGMAAGVSVRVSVRISDFLLSDLAQDKDRFDLVIANPPYFKLNKQDPRACRHAYAVYGQPNIYGLFMAACSRVLSENARWCFITPRSWTNGQYFAATRREILRWLRIDAIHVFESRQAHFADDEVLQEAVITWATARSNAQDMVTVSTSEGILDLERAVLRALPMSDVIGPAEDNVIFLPPASGIDAFRHFRAVLASYGLKVSTGPVVAFRAAQHIAETRTRGSVPLLWMQHVHPMQVRWPIRKKREHIAANAITAWMMVENGNMVIMRRFSPKEDERRIVAAPYVRGSLPGAVVGLENHTNYIYRPGGALTRDEAFGLAAFLNSRLVDQYLRTVAGNTQVNASDLRNLPMPPLEDLIKIGRHLKDGCTLTQADKEIETILLEQAVSRAA